MLVRPARGGMCRQHPASLFLDEDPCIASDARIRLLRPEVKVYRQYRPTPRSPRRPIATRHFGGDDRELPALGRGRRLNLPRPRRLLFPFGRSHDHRPPAPAAPVFRVPHLFAERLEPRKHQRVVGRGATAPLRPLRHLHRSGQQGRAPLDEGGGRLHPIPIPGKPEQVVDGKQFIEGRPDVRGQQPVGQLQEVRGLRSPGQVRRGHPAATGNHVAGSAGHDMHPLSRRHGYASVDQHHVSDLEHAHRSCRRRWLGAAGGFR